MLRPSESWSSSGKVRDIIIIFVSDSSKIDNKYLISNTLCFSAEYVIHLDISIGYIMVMKVPNCFTYLNENQSSYITEIVSFILTSYVLNYFVITLVAIVEFPPIHYLSQSAQLIYSTYPIASIDDFKTSSNVLVLQSLEYIKLIFQDIEAASELTVCCKKSLLLQSFCIVYFHCILLSSCLYSKHLPEGSTAQLADQFILIIILSVVEAIDAFELIGFLCEWFQRRVFWVSKRRCMEKFQVCQIIELLIYLFMLILVFLLRHFI